MTDQSRAKLLDLLKRSNEVEIAVTGRKSGRRHSTLVWFVLEGRAVYLVPVRGSDTQWFKNLAKNPRVDLGAGGTEVSFDARASQDESRVEPILDRFRAKYGPMWKESYYPKRDAFVEVLL